jgi:Ca-activated chloride channel family protein
VSDLGFLFPYGAALFGVLFLLAVFLRHAESSRQAALASLGLNRERIRWALPIGVTAVMICGILRPYFGFSENTIQGVGEDIVAVVDVSRSMLAKDMSPNRLGVAKRKIADLIELTARSGRGDRIGIVLFAGDTYFFLPLTADYGVARSFASAISTELIPTGGSALGQALTLVAETFKRTVSAAPRVLLLSDGEERELDPGELGSALHGQRIGVFAIGLGTIEGHPIDLGNGQFLKDTTGSIVVSRLHEEGLRQIAESTGGTYLRATLGDEDIGRFLAARGAESSTGTTTVRSYNEFGAAFAAGALLTFLVTLMTRGKARARTAILALPLLLVSEAWGEDSATERLSPFEGAKRYAAGDYPGAAEAFRSAHESLANRWDINQALGAARYKAKDYPGAVESFGNAIDRAANGRERFESLYSRGNARVMAGRLKEAIADYDDALGIKPNDADTEHNRALAQKLLEEQQQQQQQQQDQPKPQEKQNHERGKEEKSQETQPPREEDEKRDEGKEQGSKEEHEESVPPPNDQEKRSSEETKPQERDEADPSPAPSEASPEGAPPDAPPTPANERSLNEGGSPEGGDASPDDPQKLREEEAKSWLQSLDDAPVLLQLRPRRRQQRGEQIW